MSQEGLVSSNHYVVRIYPLILPPSALSPSLHPSRLFPSLCCQSTGRLTTLNILQPLFHRITHHLCSLFSSTQVFVSSSFFRNVFPGVSRSAPCLLRPAAAHINRFVLEMFSGTNGVDACLFLPFFELYLFNYEPYVSVYIQCTWMCMSTYVQYLFTVLHVYITIRRHTLEADHLVDLSVSKMCQYQRRVGTYE